MLRKQLILGNPCAKLHPCIAINILNFKLKTELSEFYSCYKLLEKTEQTAIPNSLTEIHFIELPKLIDYNEGVLPDTVLDHILKDENEIQNL